MAAVRLTVPSRPSSVTITPKTTKNDQRSGSALLMPAPGVRTVPVVPPGLADAAATITAVLDARAALAPDAVAVTCVRDAAAAADAQLTLAGLARSARAVAAELLRTVQPGARALLLYPPGVDFVVALLGCMYAGVVAVPTYPPRDTGTMSRLHGIAQDSGATLVLTIEEWLPGVRDMFAGAPATPSCRATDIEPAPLTDTGLPDVATTEVAVLQYTSGSTGDPMGVVLTHDNLLQNSKAIYERFGCTAQSKAVIWLPPYHDMGLIGGILQPLYGGFPVVLLSPLEVLARPRFWLETISTHRGTISGGPNFAYELCLRHVQGTQREELDLSSWTVAFNGAEPVRASTVRRFGEAFAGVGFSTRAWYPCYGLAEGTLLAAGGRPDAEPVVATIEGVARVGCGSPPPGHELLVVVPETRRRAEPDEIGEVWLRGPSVAQGYWQAPRATSETFAAVVEPDGAGPYLRTGDLGLLRDGELFVTGRRKELVVVAGRNVHPPDVEAALNRCHPAVRPGCGVAFALEDAGTEALAVVQEVRPDTPSTDLGELAAAVRRAVVAECEVAPARVVLVGPGTVPKTSSGKLRRLECRRRLLAGELTPLFDSSLSDGAEREHDAVEAEPTSVGTLGPADPAHQWLRASLLRVAGLQLRDADMNQTLAALGLDSLAVVRLRHDCEEHLARTPSLAVLLREDLSAVLTAVRAAPARTQDQPTRHDDDDDDRLSSGEQALWLLDRLGATGTSYQLARALVVHGPVDGAAFRDALCRAVDAYPALRSRFPTTDSGPVRVVDELDRAWLRVVDAADWDEDRLRDDMLAAAAAPYDLAQGPLLRVVFYKRSVREPVLLVGAHHMVMDYWSMLLLLDRARAEYAQERTVAPSDSRSAWLARLEALAAGDGSKQTWQFWTDELAGAPAALDLPFDRDWASVRPGAGARLGRDLPEGVADAVAALARRCSATPYAVYTAAWAAVLAAWTGEPDLVVGSPTAGRSRVDTADTVGYLVNPVPLRINVVGVAPFPDLVRHVQSVVGRALEHADYPFSDLVGRLGTGRPGRRHPVFQTMSVLYGDGPSSVLALGRRGGRLPWGDLVLETLELDAGGAQVDLTLSVAQNGSDSSFAIDYSQAFDERTVGRLAERLTRLLQGLVLDPEGTVARLTGPDADDLQRVRQRASRPAGPLELDQIHAWVARTAAAAPDATAVEHPSGSLTYAELDRLANRVAHRLRRLGVRPESRVALHTDRSVWTVVGMLGVLKAGGAYVPLDPAHPQERLDMMTQDSGAQLLLSSDAGGAGLSIEALAAQAGPQDDLDPDVLLSGHSAAYVIYTSGTTGRPKGVLVEHRGLCNLVRAQIEAFGVSPRSVVLQYASTSFDASVSEVFVTLAAGATLRLVDPWSLLPGPGLVQALGAGVTTVTLPPSVLSLVEPDRRGGPGTVVSAGEACTPDIVRMWSADGRRLLNAYGPTEATVCATIGTATVPAHARHVGRAVTGASVYVLGPDLRLVSPAHVGEVYIGGLGVARGYVGAASATALRFVADPFSDEPGSRMYRTGDVARLLEDGGLELLGRSDEQVKLRGYRIEPQEVESVLMEHPVVRQAAVAVRPLAGDQALVAYVALTGELTPTELRRHAKSRLPNYMVPAAFVAVPELPRNPAGKLDRAALPAPSGARTESEYEAPSSDRERLVAEVWQEVLGLQQIGVDDNFFDLGGHSLSATRVQLLIQERLGTELALIDLFEYTTIRTLAGRLSRGPASSPGPDVQAATRRANRRASALAQRRPTPRSPRA